MVRDGWTGSPWTQTEASMMADRDTGRPLLPPGRAPPRDSRPQGVVPGCPDPGTHSPGVRPGVPTHRESRVSPQGSPTPPRPGASVKNT